MTDERPEDVQATFAATLVDEWARGGLRAAVVCPGSRSTPLALAIDGHPDVTVHVQHDERSGGFLALGLALGSGRPTVVLVTSGTAAAELHPAVVEAHHAGVPLLVCTADRPPELRDVGAPQTIDQTHLYGRAVRWFADPGVADAATAPRWRSFAARAWLEAVGPPAGPVHLNLPFREPLVGTPAPLPEPRIHRTWTTFWPAGDFEDRSTRPWPGTADAAAMPGADVEDRSGRPLPGTADAIPTPKADVEADTPRVGTWGRSAGALTFRTDLMPDTLAGRRGLILDGEHSDPSWAAYLVRAAEILGWPVVADPRAGSWGERSPVAVAHLDGILRSARAREALRPEVILRLGGVPASRVVNEWCAASGAEEIVVPGPGWSGGAWSDPAGTVAAVVRENPHGEAMFQLARDLTVAGPERVKQVPGWLAKWRAAADAASATVRRVLPDLPASNEPAVAHDVVAALPDWSTLVVSSSMPIRDVERYAVPRHELRLMANRGANGIDGVVSTAVGIAVSGGIDYDVPHPPDPPKRGVTALLIGDLAFLHDSNGLLGIAERGVDLVCVVVDNDGGGIFSFLPQARQLPEERFETLFGTPHGLDLVALAQAYGVPARAVDPTTGETVAEAVATAATADGPHVLVVRTDRATNVDAHRKLDDAIAAAVDQALDPSEG